MNLGVRIRIPEGFAPRRAMDFANVEITRGLETLAMEFERRVKARTPVGVFGESGLRGSIAGEVRGVPARSAMVATASPYGAVIEHGRRPGPISATGRQALALWVQKKLGVPAEEAPRVAFLVARKIRRRGFPGAHMFERALAEGRGVIDQVWRTVGERIAARLGGNPMG